MCLVGSKSIYNIIAIMSFDYTVSYDIIHIIHQESEPVITRDKKYLLYKLLASYNYVKYVPWTVHACIN